MQQTSDEQALRELLVNNSGYGLSPAQLSKIAVPTAIIWGSGDSIGGSLSQTVVNLHHPPVHIIKDASHVTMMANPVAFAQAVESP